VATQQTSGSTFAPHSFDTVIDTFGLCSCDDPVGVSVQGNMLNGQLQQLMLLRALVLL
jgi:hypothetical protein